MSLNQRSTRNSRWAESQRGLAWEHWESKNGCAKFFKSCRYLGHTCRRVCRVACWQGTTAATCDKQSNLWFSNLWHLSHHLSQSPSSWTKAQMGHDGLLPLPDFHLHLLRPCHVCHYGYSRARHFAIRLSQPRDNLCQLHVLGGWPQLITSFRPRCGTKKWPEASTTFFDLPCTVGSLGDA